MNANAKVLDLARGRAAGGRAGSPPADPVRKPARRAGQPRRAGGRGDAAVQPAAMAGEERMRMVAEAAYFRAERRGFLGGCALQDWLEAEAEIDALLRAC